MAEELTPRVVYANGEWFDEHDTGTGMRYDWTVDPVFEFGTEVQALQTLEFMAEDYRAALRQAEEILRYVKAGIAAARTMPEGERPRPQAIINHTRLGRQTVYDVINRLTDLGEASSG